MIERSGPILNSVEDIREGSWRVHLRSDREFPLREGPIRFAVMMKDGSTSNGWRAWVGKEGDAYICCRDNINDLKVSLHKSGRQHIAHTRQSGKETASEERYWNTWREPPVKGKVIPSFKLMFPPWGVRLSERDRNKTSTTRRKWGDNQVLIEQDERLMVAVDFILRDEDFLLDGSGHPIVILAVLPAPVNGRQNRQIFAIVRKESPEHFRGIVQRALNKIPSGLGDKIADLRLRGEVPVACITGYGDEDGSHAYMIVVPVAALSDNSPTLIASTYR